MAERFLDHVITKISEMDIKQQPSNVELNDTKRQKLDVVEPQPSTSAASHGPDLMASVSKEDAGQVEGESLSFYHSVVMLLLINLREMNHDDNGFQYQVWTKRKEYGKFGDIVVRYQKLGGECIEICVQCVDENSNPDESKTVDNITAGDFLSGKDKSFSLVEYIKSFVDIREKNKDRETYYMILSNRAYNEGTDSNYPFFQREEIVAEITEKSLMFPWKNGFQIKYNNQLGDLVEKFATSAEGDEMTLNENVIPQFCSNFMFNYVGLDLEEEIREKLAKFCNDHVKNVQKLYARLYSLVSHERKICLNQNDVKTEFDLKNTFFNVPNTCLKFTGREKEIGRIKKALDCDKKDHIFDLLVTGMTGVGKSQTVRKYIDTERSKYKHVVWINAENKKSLENSFVDLANSCDIMKIDLRYDITTLMKQIYSHFENRTLFVYDNSSNELMSKNERNEYIYLPNNDRTKFSSKFLVISQDKKWTVKCSRVCIDKFSKGDALLYLEDTTLCSKKDKVRLAEMFQYWPLALSFAVDYINLMTEKNLDPKICSDIITNLQVQIKNVSKRGIEKHKECLQSLWLLIQKHLQIKDKLSLKIIHILSFSDPDNFPIDLLAFDGSSKVEINGAVTTLRCTSLVTVADCKMTLHHTLHSVIRNCIISDTELYESTLLYGAQCFKKYLSSVEITKSIGNDHMVTFLHHICESKIDPEKYIAMANLTLKKLIFSKDLRKHCGINGIFEKLLALTKQKLGENYLETCSAMFRIADLLRETGNYEESLSLYSKVEKVYNQKLGKKDTLTILCKDRMALVLSRMKKYEDAICIYNEMIENQKDDYPEVFVIMDQKATVLVELEKYEEAICVYAQEIDLLKKIHGENSVVVLSTLMAKAQVLLKMGENDDALAIYNHIIEEQTKQFGATHPNVLAVMSNKAAILRNTFKHEEALIIYSHIVDILTAELGETHMKTLQSLRDKAEALIAMEKYKEAFDIYTHHHGVCTQLFHKHHPLILKDLQRLVFVSNKLGNYKLALSMCNQVLEMRTDKNDPIVLQSMLHKAIALQNLGNYEEAMCLHNTVIEKGTELVGESHIDILLSMNNKTLILIKMGKIEEAMRTCNKVLKLKKGELSRNDLTLLFTLHNKATIQHKMRRHEESLGNYNFVTKMRKQMLGDRHPDTVEVIDTAFNVLHEWTM